MAEFGQIGKEGAAFKAGHPGATSTGIIPFGTADRYFQISAVAWVGNSCGVGGIHDLYGDFSEAADAEFIAGLYRLFRMRGHVLYVITDFQANKVIATHRALLKIGSRMLTEFPNLQHGPNKIQIWLVNVRDAVGKFCDEAGELLKPAAKELPEIVKVLAITKESKVTFPQAALIKAQPILRKAIFPHRDPHGRYIKKVAP